MMQPDNKKAGVVLVDSDDIESEFADLATLQLKSGPPTRSVPPPGDKAVTRNDIDDMPEKPDVVPDKGLIGGANLDRDSSPILNEDQDSDDVELEDITHSAHPDRDLLNLRAWREETDQDLYFLSDWEASQAVRAESASLQVETVDEDIHDFEEATEASKPEMIQFNHFLAAHNCNIYNHDPSLTFDEDFTKCATAWVWLPGTQAYAVFRTRALAEEGRT